MLDERLTWKPHVSYVGNRVNKQVGIIYQIRDSLPLKACMQLYYSLNYRYINYYQTIWGSANKSIINNLLITQKRAVRTISGLRKNDHTNDVFRNLKILKLREINIYCCSLFIYKHITLPSNNYFPERQNSRYPYI